MRLPAVRSRLNLQDSAELLERTRARARSRLNSFTGRAEADGATDVRRCRATGRNGRTGRRNWLGLAAWPEHFIGTSRFRA